MPLKILHTADIHLGARVRFLGKKAYEQQQRINSALDSIVQTAIQREVHLVLIAGDIFDYVNPTAEQNSSFRTMLKQLADREIYTALIHGNHDYLKADSQPWGFSNSFIHEFTKDTVWDIPQLDTTVFGLSVTSPTDTQKPLKEVSFKTDSLFSVGLFHGSVDFGKNNTKSSHVLFSSDDIDATDVDYIALGDWHGMLDVSGKAVSAWYSGSPEIVSNNQENAGNMLVVTIEDDHTTSVVPVKTSKTKLVIQTVDITTATSLDAIIDKITQYDQNTLLYVKLIGLAQFAFSTLDIQRVLEENCFGAIVKDNSTLTFDEKVLDSHKENLLLTEFVKQVDANKSASEEIKTMAKQLGMKLLLEGDSIREL